MLGAVCGDIVGSVYEWFPIKRKDFQPLFAQDARLTDDTVLTVAVADALLNGKEVASTLKVWGRRYPDVGWGGMFRRWLFSEESAPYGSFGNGAAMRVSPAALLARDLDEALELSRKVTEVTHNHPEGLRGAAATVTAIFLARQGERADRIRREIERRFGYDLSRSVEEIRPDYRFDETCQGTVPEAITCALEAEGFEDALRNAVSLGGDADTLAAIAGPIAEARFGIPKPIAREAYRRLPAEMQELLSQLYRASGVPKPW